MLYIIFEWNFGRVGSNPPAVIFQIYIEESLTNILFLKASHPEFSPNLNFEWKFPSPNLNSHPNSILRESFQNSPSAEGQFPELSLQKWESSQENSHQRVIVPRRNFHRKIESSKELSFGG